MKKTFFLLLSSGFFFCVLQAAKAEKESLEKSKSEQNQAGIRFLQNNIVARPAAASQVTWPIYPVVGRDFWQVLTPHWLSMTGVDQEAFVQNSGLELKFNYTNYGVNRGDLRKSKIKELELIRDGVNTASEALLQFSSDEPEVLFYTVNNVQDGDLNTCAFIIGSSADFRKRNDGVPFEIRISQKNSHPLQKIRLITETHGCAPPAWIEVYDSSGKVLAATYERDDKRGLWELTLTPPSAENNLQIRGKTCPSFYRLAGTPENLKTRLKQVPFMNRNFYFRSHMADLKKENIDRDSIRKMQQEFPETFIGQIVGEVASNYFQKRANPVRFREYLAEQASYVPVYDRTREEAEAGLKIHWRRHVDFFGNLCAMTGGLMTAPYFYEWGTPMVMAGSINERPWSNNRSNFTMTRSGARQYGKPWAAYLTSYAWGASASSHRNEEEALQLVSPQNPWPEGLDFGLAPSVFKRCQYIAYYSGTNFQLFETDPLGMAVQNRSNKQWELTENGKTVKDLYDWSVKPEGKRGDFYAPILLLTDYHHGNWEWKRDSVWKTWYMFPYQDADYMFQHINRAFDPFPGHDFGADSKKMIEKGWSVFNSKLGDIYDVYFANPPSGVITVPELGKYPFAMLVGDLRFSTALFTNLKHYVAQGGTLVINAAQDAAFFSDPDFLGVQVSEEWIEFERMKLRRLEQVSGEIVAEAANGMPLIVRNRYEKGNVLFMTPYYLLDIKDMKKPLPLIEAFLEKVQSEVCPVQISGDIHFLFNKMSSGSWKLVLLNHRGVYKNAMRTKEHYFPEYAAEVRIVAPAGTKATEVRLGQEIRQQGNSFLLTVPPGEICVLDLEQVAFDDKPLDERPFVRKSSIFTEFNPNQGLLLESNFAQQQENLALDSSGLKNHGTIFPEPDYEGNSLRFDGEKTYVLYYLEVPKTPLSEGTLECWVWPDGSLRDADQIVMTNEWIKIGIDKGKWNANFYDFLKADTIHGEPAQFDQWTHLIFTWDKNIARFFVNGREVVRPSGPLLHVQALDGIGDKKVRLFLGTHHFHRARVFKGLITDVRYFGHFLSENTIVEHYQKGLETRK